MTVSELINKLQPYSDYELKPVIHLSVAEEELQKRLYKYPHDNYEADLDIDDIGHSDKFLIIGISLKE